MYLFALLSFDGCCFLHHPLPGQTVDFGFLTGRTYAVGTARCRLFDKSLVGGTRSNGASDNDIHGVGFVVQARKDMACISESSVDSPEGPHSRLHMF